MAARMRYYVIGSAGILFPFGAVAVLELMPGPGRSPPYLEVVILLALLVVLLFVATGFAMPLSWIAALMFLVIWLVGFTLGRSGNGKHDFYHW
jgi:type IV secretory pathway TrbD component